MASQLIAPSPAEARTETIIEVVAIGLGPLFGTEAPVAIVWTPEEPLE